MNGNRVIVVAIIVCIMMLCWVLWKKQMAIMLGRALMGAGAIWAINMLVPDQVKVGINLVNLVIVGVLGLPGVGMVYIINILI